MLYGHMNNTQLVETKLETAEIVGDKQMFETNNELTDKIKECYILFHELTFQIISQKKKADMFRRNSIILTSGN